MKINRKACTGLPICTLNHASQRQIDEKSRDEDHSGHQAQSSTSNDTIQPKTTIYPSQAVRSICLQAKKKKCNLKCVKYEEDPSYNQDLETSPLRYTYASPDMPKKRRNLGIECQHHLVSKNTMF